MGCTAVLSIVKRRSHAAARQDDSEALRCHCGCHCTQHLFIHLVGELSSACLLLAAIMCVVITAEIKKEEET